MKIANPRALLAALCLALLAMPAGLALAHTQTGSLATGAAATDYYQVTCSDDGDGPPGSLVFQVENVSSPTSPLANVLVQKGIMATSSSDPTNGDGVASPLVWINGLDGVYNLYLSKTSTGAVNYTITYHCMTGANGTGLHTGTDIVFKQRGFPP
jgi:hypothetical protein